MNSGQANGLTSKLDNVLAKLEAGQDHVAVNLLSAFINQVTDLVATGVLSEPDGQILIDPANGSSPRSGSNC